MMQGSQEREKIRRGQRWSVYESEEDLETREEARKRRKALQRQKKQEEEGSEDE